MNNGERKIKVKLKNVKHMSLRQYKDMCQAISIDCENTIHESLCMVENVDFLRFGIYFPSLKEVRELMEKKLFKLDSIHYFIIDEKKFLWAKLKFNL